MHVTSGLVAVTTRAYSCAWWWVSCHTARSLPTTLAWRGPAAARESKWNRKSIWKVVLVTEDAFVDTSTEYSCHQVKRQQIFSHVPKLCIFVLIIRQLYYWRSKVTETTPSLAMYQKWNYLSLCELYGKFYCWRSKVTVCFIHWTATLVSYLGLCSSWSTVYVLINAASIIRFSPCWIGLGQRVISHEFFSLSAHLLLQQTWHEV